MTANPRSKIDSTGVIPPSWDLMLKASTRLQSVKASGREVNSSIEAILADITRALNMDGSAPLKTAAEAIMNELIAIETQVREVTGTSVEVSAKKSERKDPQSVERVREARRIAAETATTRRDLIIAMNSRLEKPKNQRRLSGVRASGTIQ